MDYWTLAEASHAIRRKHVSPVEVVDHLLKRIDRLEPIYRSYVTVLGDRARDKAREAEAEISRGFWRGPLHGVPVTVKDIIFTEYAPTTAGMPIYRDFATGHSATIVDRLETAGAIVIGKVKTVEGAWTEHHPSEPAPINPWNADYWAGASSSGSGVATALGLCFASIGSDTGGSIRLPSQSAGIVGLKPTWGRVSRHGVFALARSLDHLGPMTRTAEDAALMLAAIAGEDENDPTSLAAKVPNYADACTQNIRGLRVGIDPDYVFEGSSDDVVRVVKEAMEALASAGAVAKIVKVPSYRDAVAGWASLLQIEVAYGHRETFPARASEYGPALSALIELGRAATTADVAANLLARPIFNNRLAALFDNVDVLLVPVTPGGVPSKVEAENLRDDVAVEFIKYTAPYNLSGHPTLTVAAGFDRKGLPVSLQFVGPHLSEALICRMGAAFQRVTDWHTRHPPV